MNFTNALAAGLVLGVMIIPTVASLSEDALSAVPQALRQGSLAMGANRMQTTLRVVLPAALSGVAAAVVLGMSRAVGETMIVALAAGAQKNLSLDPREGMQTMTGFIATTAQGENPVGSTSYNTLFAVGLTAVRDHADHQHHQHRVRPTVSGRSTDERRHHHGPRGHPGDLAETQQGPQRRLAGVPRRCSGSRCSSA